MPKDKTQLTKQVYYLGEISTPLGEDTSRAMYKLKKQSDRGLRNSRDFQEISFWGKVAVSCFFTHMNAVGHTMRKMVQLFHNFGNLSLTNREIAKLAEYKYDSQADEITKIKKPLPSIESFKLGIRYFAKQLGADFTLETGDDRWRGLRNLQDARKRFTHPERIEDLYATEMFRSLQSSAVWFYSEMARFFEAAREALGVEGGDHKPRPLPSTLRPMNVEIPPFFSKDDLEQEVVVAGRTLPYTLHFLRKLRYDSRRAEGIWKKFAKRENDTAQFARRIVLLTQARQVEALSNITWFLLENARRMGEISFFDEEVGPKSNLPPKLGYLISRVNLWSREVGTGAQITPDEDATMMLTKAWRQRDRIIHPGLPRDLEVSRPDTVQFTLALKLLEVQAYNCMQVDPSKWLEAFERGRTRRDKLSGKRKSTD